MSSFFLFFTFFASTSTRKFIRLQQVPFLLRADPQGTFLYKGPLCPEYEKTCSLLETGFFASAGGGTWTLMVLLPHGPEPCASANSATSAFLLCRFVYISQRHVELYYKTVILSTTFSKKYFLKKFKKVLAKSFRLWYIITRRWELNNKSSERYAEVSELADEQD